MATIRITKAQIIEAIASEPLGVLQPGAWIYPNGGWATPASSACSVCAVGSVIRRALNRNASACEINDVAYSATELGVITGDGDELHEAQHGRWLNALSICFERASSNTDQEHAREETIRFVRDEFPDSIVVGVGSFEPAPEFEIVSLDEAEG